MYGTVCHFCTFEGPPDGRSGLYFGPGEEGEREGTAQRGDDTLSWVLGGAITSQNCQKLSELASQMIHRLLTPGMPGMSPEEVLSLFSEVLEGRRHLF